MWRGGGSSNNRSSICTTKRYMSNFVDPLRTRQSGQMVQRSHRYYHNSRFCHHVGSHRSVLSLLPGFDNRTTTTTTTTTTTNSTTQHSFRPTTTTQQRCFFSQSQSKWIRGNFGSMVLSLSSSSSSMRMQSSLDFQPEENYNNDTTFSSISIEENGSQIRLMLPNSMAKGEMEKEEDSHAVHFPAAWLWVQDPQAIHGSSGQRLRTLGQYDPKIHSIVNAKWRQDVTNELPISKRTTPLPPPLGSYHSRGGIYENTNEDNNTYISNSIPHSNLFLDVEWKDGLTSTFDWHWLEQFASATPPTTSVSTRSSTSTKVTVDLAIGAKNGVTEQSERPVSIPVFDYEDILKSDWNTLQALQEINQHGAMLVEGAPLVYEDEMTNQQEDSELSESRSQIVSDSTVANLGKRLGGGRLSHGSLYGDTFRVISQPNAQNIAYTTLPLAPHQDLTYYESKPFLQLLHCVSNAAKGGASVLIDAMAATEYLRIIAPDLFNTLCTVEATFCKQRPGADMISFKPHIQVSTSKFDPPEVVAVNWSPPFEGPLMMDNNSSSSSMEWENYSRAYQALEVLLDCDSTSNGSLLDTSLYNTLKEYAKTYTWQQVLQPGQILVFNNQRMCHGRRGFELSTTPSDIMKTTDSNQTNNTSHLPLPTRHLIGCYTDAMETINTYRVLKRDHRLQSTNSQSSFDWTKTQEINTGNGSRASSI